MESWLEQLKVSGPLAMVLGTGIVTLWRWATKTIATKDEEIGKLQNARVNDLKEIVERSESSD